MLGTAPGGLVGRSAELAEIDAFLKSSGQGFAVLAVEGEPGIGKTALLAESMRRARARGARVLSARATESELGLALCGLGDLFEDVEAPSFELLPGPQAEALRAALLRAPAGARGIDERALYAGALSMLRLLASSSPLIVAVDDAQWLDHSTARALRFALRRLGSEPIGVLATVRVWEQGVATFVEAADEERRATLCLGPLSAAALHEVIKNKTGRSLSRPAVVELARSCAGNPLYALEIAGTLADRTGHGSPAVAPSLRELVSARLGRLPAPTRQALALAAVSSNPTTALVDAEALRPAVADGIVTLEAERVEFAHPLFASAVYGLLDAEGRRAVHRVLADRVEEPEESARHAALAAAGPEPATASRLDSAAAIAERRGAPLAAAELVELALACTPGGDGDGRLERMLRAAAHWLAAGDLERAQELLESLLADSAAPPIRARALQLLAQLRGRRSSFAEAATAANEALAAVGEDPELRAAIELDVAYCHASVGDLDGTEVHARAALELASAAHQPGAYADALAVTTMVRFLRGAGVDEEGLATAIRLEDRERRSPMQMRPSYVRGHLRLWTGQLDEGLPILEQIHDDALERGEESPVPLLDFYLVWGWLWRGELGRAAELAAEAAQLASLLGDHAAAGSALVCSALVHAHQGALPEARSEAMEAIQRFEQLGWPIFVPWALWALGLAELSDGDPVAAHAVLGPATDRLLAMGSLDPALAVFLPDEIEAVIELGDLERAEALVAWLEARGTALERPWVLAVAGRCRGLLTAACGDLDGALAALERALAQHRLTDMPLDRGRTLLAHGRLQRRARQRSLAGTTLAEALELFEGLGARRFAQRAASELDALRVRSAHPDRLTATEARVAELAAAGLANRAVAQQAMLSLKAVEANLTRVYRKLGVSSRAGLGAALQATKQGDDAE